MASRTQLQPPPPILRTRDLLRMASLLFMALFAVWAIWKARKPETWVWAANVKSPSIQQAVEPPAAKPQEKSEGLSSEWQLCTEQTGGFLTLTPWSAATPGNLGVSLWVVLNYEFAAPAERVAAKPLAVGRAPVPSAATLEGAIDREGFLVEDFTKPEDERSPRDEEARNHLIGLVGDPATKAEDLAADALKEVRYSQLLLTPDKYRGKIIHLQGILRRVDRFDMQHPPPGVKQFYRAWMTVGRQDQEQVYCILFAELPPGFPPEKDWGPQVFFNTQFDGYFLKLLRAESAKDPSKVFPVPVLVGKTVQLPPVAPAGAGAGGVALYVAGGFVATVLVCLVALLLYRRGDRRVSARMGALREAHLAPDIGYIGTEDGGFSLEDDTPDGPPRPHRNGLPKSGE